MFVEQEWILKRAALTPHHIALINLTSKEQWTYQQLSEEIGKWSQFFERQQLQKEVESLFCEKSYPIVCCFIRLWATWAYLCAVKLALKYGGANTNCRGCDPAILLYDEASHCPLVLDKMFSLHVSQHEKDLQSCTQNVDVDDPWLMIYTGGTTGRPKG